MRFKFEKFTEVDASFAARVTIRQRTGQIGFNAGAVNRFSLQGYGYSVLYFDTENKVIGMEPVKEKVEGAIEIKHRPSNTYLSAKNFLDKYGIDAIAAHVRMLSGSLIEGMVAMELDVITPTETKSRAGNAAFTRSDTRSVVQRANEDGILIWGDNGRIRASAHLFATTSDVDIFLDRLPGYLG